MNGTKLTGLWKNTSKDGVRGTRYVGEFGGHEFGGHDRMALT